MARKNLLRDLMAVPDEPAKVDGGQLSGPVHGPERRASGAGAGEVDGRQPAAAPSGFGAIGAVGRSIADLKSRALIEIDPALIDAGGLTDRIGADAEDDARLLASIRDHGQQVPVLARPHPGVPGRYQIVYGRRRARALAALGRPVRALVRELDDRDLLLAQGQENSARRDLSFIEKACFARQIIEAGHDRATAQAALSTDKTQMSRMLSVTERLPAGVIAAIGPAHGIGRDRWLGLATLYAALAPGEDAAARVAAGRVDGRQQSGAAEPGSDSGAGQGSDARFEALETWLRARAAEPRGRRARLKSAPGRKAAEPEKGPEVLRGDGGAELAILMRRPEHLALLIENRDFGVWLVENLSAFHRRWLEEAPAAKSASES